MVTSLRLHHLSIVGVLGIALTACEQATPPQGPPPARVSVITVEPSAVPIINELPGRLSATRVAEVRARISGIVLERKFEEGSEVEAGQILFQIDPAPLREYVDAFVKEVRKIASHVFHSKELGDYHPRINHKRKAGGRDPDPRMRFLSLVMQTIECDCLQVVADTLA